MCVFVCVLYIKDSYTEVVENNKSKVPENLIKKSYILP